MSCAEIRRLFWQLVLLVVRSAEAVLGWSRWRRRHQAEARRHHYRRRAERASSPSLPTRSEQAVDEQASAASPSDLVERVWQRLQPLLPSGKRRGPGYTHDRRLLLEAIVHQMQTGCGWQHLPPQFPPFQTVHWQLRQWQKSGLWAKVWDGLEQPRLSG